MDEEDQQAADKNIGKKMKKKNTSWIWWNLVLKVE